MILCGGVGRRLWPISSPDCPKPFVQLFGKQSLYQQTLNRVEKLSSFGSVGDNNYLSPIVVCNSSHRFLAEQQAKDLRIELSAILLEPVQKNTAPALTIAAQYIRKNFPGSLMLVLPADHTIDSLDSFALAINQLVVRVINSDKLLGILGVKPDRPATEYGYIKSAIYSDDYDLTFGRVNEFIEKPEMNKAKQLIELADYYWNTGILLVKDDDWIELIDYFVDDLASSCRDAVDQGSIDLSFFRVEPDSFKQAKSISIDYAVLEHQQRLNKIGYRIDMVEVLGGWSDLGTWNSFSQYLARSFNIAQHQQGELSYTRDYADASNAINHDSALDTNIFLGDVTALDSNDNLVIAKTKPITLAGVSNSIIIETSSELVILDKDKLTNGQLDQIFDRDYILQASFERKYRPWGYYQVLVKARGYQIKKLLVKPRQALSLQLHKHRAEHWVVVEGIAEVTSGNESYRLEVNQSTYIPQEQIHRLENNTLQDLVIIEIQTGEYLDENDIVRFEDDFGRV
ncbi:MAG: sugar phosphate nucleotidyltransferase [Kangiellaceae bacterium]|nr:sugar phosphate nucleotidyltransferase [Kangiellaceae bacterium]